MKIICEFDFADPNGRKRSRVIEDEDGLWKVQSLIAATPGPDKWEDEFKPGSGAALNMDIILKSVAAVKNAL